ncbi:MAG TPA: ribbon-helix-helix protein, CopG family [Solirubrobacteraceae bacterium]|nr:ribbon-helix-helix protein, CopG family [Solirubrobacteraceae bacterium]
MSAPATTSPRGVSVKLPDDTYAALKAQAEREERTITAVLKRAVRAYIENGGDEQ